MEYIAIIVGYIIFSCLSMCLHKSGLTTTEEGMPRSQHRSVVDMHEAETCDVDDWTCVKKVLCTEPKTTCPTLR